MRTIFKSQLAAIALALLFSGCVLETVNETIEKQSVQDARSFRSLAVLDQGSNDIAITGATTDSIRASAYLDVWANNSERARRVADRMDFGWEGGSEAKLKLNYSGADQELAKLTRLALTVPKDLGVKIETGSGDVAIAQMASDLNVETSSGNISASTSGRVTLKTSSGDITASTKLGGSLDMSSGDATIGITSKDFDGLDVTSSSGDVVVNLADSAHVTLDLSTSSGSINVNYSGTRTSTTSGDLKLQVNGGGRIIRVETSSGDIRIQTLR
jgi:DUF4097 and DUF4098 domain-containing protein YvlB